MACPPGQTQTRILWGNRIYCLYRGAIGLQEHICRWPSDCCFNRVPGQLQVKKVNPCTLNPLCWSISVCIEISGLECRAGSSRVLLESWDVTGCSRDPTDPVCHFGTDYPVNSRVKILYVLNVLKITFYWLAPCSNDSSPLDERAKLSSDLTRCLELSCPLI